MCAAFHFSVLVQLSQNVNKRLIFESGQLYKIVEVFAQKYPPMFKLVDLKNDEVSGYFYQEELTKSAPFDVNKDYFFIEKVLKTKIVKGEKFLLVKYLFYPDKVNERSP